MKPVQIKIHKLGRIGESEVITLNRFMLFSGESGLGKSYISIVCNYIFYILSDSKNNSLLSNFISEYTAPNASQIVYKKADLERWLATEAIHWVGYMTHNTNVAGDIEISLPTTVPEQITIKKSQRVVLSGSVKNKNRGYIRYVINDKEEYLFDEAYFSAVNRENPLVIILRDFLAKAILETPQLRTETFVFPASRGAMFTEHVEPLSGIYECFGNNIPELLKARPYENKQNPANTEILKYLLDGEIRYENSQYMYITNDGTTLPLSAAASSVRELTPFTFLLKNVPLDRVALMIDEPEAHLHPMKQRLMADLLSGMCNGGAYLQVTTHSDYMIRRINELVMKEQIYRLTNGGKEYAELCRKLNTPQELRLNPDIVSAYLLRRNGDASIVEKQDMTNGIPFVSFIDALKESLKMQDQLSSTLEKLKGENDEIN